MTPRRMVVLLIAAALVVLSWVQVSAARSGLTVRSLERDGVPMLFVAPRAAARVPAVIVAHGFASSKQMMLGYGYTLAHAGYAALLLDFGGHGANAGRLVRDGLQRDLDTAYAVLIEQGEVDGSRVALVGHSMGSGAVMAAGIRDPERYAAVVAVSPTGAGVTPEAPRNLLLQAGGWEGRFIDNARALLAAAGDESGGFAAGSARRLTIVPRAEHISILFRRESHQAVLDWLGQVFGEPRQTAYVDRRIAWYALHLAAWLAIVLALAPMLRSGPRTAAGKRMGRDLLGLAAGAAAAIAVLFVGNRLVSLQSFGGLQVGAPVGLWLAVAGLIWLLAGGNIARPSLKGLLLGILLFGFLTAAFGVMAQPVWVQWWLVPPRLWRWILLAAACLPWFLAAGRAQQGAQAGKRALWWLIQSVAMLGGLFLTLTLVPSLWVLVLMMPLLPVVLGLLTLAGTPFDQPWPYAIGSALFFGWMLAAVFPLV